MLRVLLYLQIALSRLARLVRSPLTWWESRVQAKRDHEARLLALQIESQTALTREMTLLVRQVVETTAEGQRAQAQFLQNWMQSWQTSEVPVSTTVREADEIRMAQERELAYLHEHGIPVHTNPYEVVEDWMPRHVTPEQRLEGFGVDVEALRRHITAQ